jgi:putative transposase
MCKTLGVSRSTYYKLLNPKRSSRDFENHQLQDEILKIYNSSKKRYGAPKIHQILAKKGLPLSLKRVQKLMRKLNIKAIIVKKYRAYSSKNKVQDKENILNRDFSTTGINQKWVSDITYIKTVKHGWCYLASVMDLHTKKIIGYDFSKSMDINCVIKALKNAYNTQKPTHELILHTDLGTQYTSDDFSRVIKELKITHSFSKKGCPYDNACIESFHATLKKEEVNLKTYYDFESAKLALFEYIESWYNRARIHSSISYCTPQEFENRSRNLA